MSKVVTYEIVVDYTDGYWEASVMYEGYELHYEADDPQTLMLAVANDLEVTVKEEGTQ